MWYTVLSLHSYVKGEFSMQTYTAQQLFDTIVTGLLKQGKRSFEHCGKRGITNFENEERCMYRSAEGFKCAIGHVITNEDYDPEMEDISSTVLFEKFPVLSYLIPHADMLRELQSIHDYGIPLDWPADFTNVAEDFGLDPAIINTIPRG